MTVSKLTDTSSSKILFDREKYINGNVEMVFKQLLATYSYCKIDGINKILIPGKPQFYKEFQVPKILAQETGLAVVDENGCRIPKAPMDVAIMAITKLAPKDFNIGSLDVIVDRNIIKHLFRFAFFRKKELPTARKIGIITDWKQEKGFGFIRESNGMSHFAHVSNLITHPDARGIGLKIPIGSEVEFSLGQAKNGKVNAMDITSRGGEVFAHQEESVNIMGIMLMKTGTLVIRRMERKLVDSVVGYGFSFEDASCLTPSSPEGISGFWNINHFDMGGLSVAVRSEADAVCSKNGLKTRGSELEGYSSSNPKEITKETPSKLELKQFSEEEGIDPNMILEIGSRDEMNKIAQDNFTFELKCLSNTGEGLKINNPLDYYNQMLLGNVDKIVIAEQNKGYISKIPNQFSKTEFANFTAFDIKTLKSGYSVISALFRKLKDELKDHIDESFLLSFDSLNGEVTMEPSNLAPVSAGTRIVFQGGKSI